MPETTAEPHRTPLVGLDRGRLAELLDPNLDRGYRVEQIFKAIHERSVDDLQEVTTLGKELRRKLAEEFRIGLPEITEKQFSADGTVKYLFRMADGASVEAVDIPDEGRRTLCISSQAGCALACRFCVTGYWGAGRDLSVGEIVGQVVRMVGGLSLEQSLNLVFMGMGEPLLNLEAVRSAIELLTEWISWRRITVSTVGVVPGIEAMSTWPKRPNLAVSLHAPDDERRSRLMPINRKYPLPQLLEALRRYPLEPGRQLTIEYILIRDVNDAPPDAEALADLIRPLEAKVNLIPVNPDPVLDARMVPPDEETVERFRARLEERGRVATVRRRRGDDVAGACGQLRGAGREPRGFPEAARAEIAALSSPY